MPKVIGSASGNNLKITIPERGEKNWDELIENSCFTPISNHSHTGNGDGAKIDTDALEDGAVTNTKLESAIQGKLTQVDSNTTSIANLQTDVTNNTNSITNNSNTISTHTTDISIIQQWNLANLNDVASTAPTSGQVLSWNGTSWAPATSSGGSGGSSNVYLLDTVAAAQAYDALTGTSSVGNTIIMSSSTVDLQDLSIDLQYATIYVTTSSTIFFNRLSRCNVIARGGISVTDVEGCNIHTETNLFVVAVDGNDPTTNVRESVITCNGLEVFVDSTQGASSVSFQDVDIKINGNFTTGFGDHINRVRLGPSTNISAERLFFGNTTEQDIRMTSNTAVLKVTGSGSSNAVIKKSTGDLIATISNVSEPFEVSNYLYKNSSGAIVIDSTSAMNIYGAGTPGDTILIPSTTTAQLHFTAALDGIKIISKTTVAQSFDSLTNCELYVEDFMAIGGGNLTNTRIICDDMLDITTTSGTMSITNCDIICDTLRLSNSGTVQLRKSNVKAMILTQNSNLYSDNNFRVFEQSNLEFGGLGADFSTQGIMNGNYGLISFRISFLGRVLKVEDSSAIVTIYNSGVPAEIVGSTSRQY